VCGGERRGVLAEALLEVEVRSSGDVEDERFERP
jgi:hypothetical protein